jgi:uncharacterized membrane protein YraQ (UPF0718 family)
MNSKKLKHAAVTTFNSFKMSLPVLIGVLLLISLIIYFLPKKYLNLLFTGNAIIDPVIGAVIGSILAGNPLTSYIIGGELLKHGMSLLAVTAFIVSWVTVGIVQLPAESVMLGKKFAIVRNCMSFIMAVIIAVLTSITVSIV